MQDGKLVKLYLEIQVQNNPKPTLVAIFAINQPFTGEP